MKIRNVAGCMTGTSLDGLDVAIVEVLGSGLAMQVRVLDTRHTELAEPLRETLVRLASDRATTPARIAEAALLLGRAHSEALAPLAAAHALDLIAVHGQTVLHRPPLSWQLINPHPLAQTLGVPVVFDLRGADLAAGGQGAPITPLADFILFHSPEETRAIVNLGGFCNLTLLPPSIDVARIGAQDVCACNQVLDAIARARLKTAYDVDGQVAASGQVKARLYADLVDLLGAQASGKRSLGTGDELHAWVTAQARVDPADLLRTACAAIAKVTSDHLREADRVLVAGGSARNRTLIAELEARLGVPVETTAAHGIAVDAREAVEIAILGALCQDREPITLPQVTHLSAPAPISGAWLLP